MRPVILVGPWPPPYGGNSTHIKRLAYRLAADARAVCVADPYSGALVFPSVNQADAGQPGSSATLLRRAVLLGRLAAASPGRIVHFHMSAGDSFYRFAPLLLRATCTAGKRILTVHSGRWASEFEALTHEGRARVTRVLSAFTDIICVSDIQMQVLTGLVRGRLHLIPAYLPATVPSNAPLPAEIVSLQSRVDALVMTSGYGTPIYDFETVLRGVELAQMKLEMRLGLVVATYAKWDATYWPAIADRLQRSRVPVVTTTNLDPATFLAVLSESRLYIRGTRTDGDAVSIREAASVGARVLASDAVPRPSGTAIFPQGDSGRLADLILIALERPSVGLLDASASFDRYRDIVAVYETT